MQAHTRARGHPKPPLATRSGPGICEAKPGSCVFNCILEQGGCRTPRPPLIRGRQARREAPAEPAPRGRPEDRPRQSRQDRSRSGSPGTRLGRPFGPGFALRPGLIGRKDHGRRRAQAARQSRTAVMGAPAPSARPKRKRRPRRPPHARRKRLRVGPGDSGRGLAETPPALSRRGPVPAKMRGIFTGPAPAY